jgi:hypothetical protein
LNRITPAEVLKFMLVAEGTAANYEALSDV